MTIVVLIVVVGLIFLAGRHSVKPTVQVLRETRPSFNDEQKRQIYIWFHGQCAYCGQGIPPRSLDWHIDHVRPWSKGGSNDPHNLALACASCNLSKGDSPNWAVKYPPSGPVPTFGPIKIEGNRSAWRLIGGWLGRHYRAALLAGVALVLGGEFGPLTTGPSGSPALLVAWFGLVLFAWWWLYRRPGRR